MVRHALGLTDELVIFGEDHPTPDGTCVRDYIHVTDLAEAHLLAWAKLDDEPLIRLNLGTGKGHSNLEVVRTVAEVANQELFPRFGPKRPGDPPELVADPRQPLNCSSGGPQDPVFGRLLVKCLNGPRPIPKATERGYRVKFETHSQCVCSKEING